MPSRTAYDEHLAEQIEKRLIDFNPRKDLLVVPSSALPMIDGGIPTIGLEDLRNVARVRVGY